MKTIIKLLITAAIVNAAARSGMAAARYYELKDAAQELVTFGAQMPTGQLQNQIIAKAEELSVPLGSDDVDVSRDGLHTTAVASYTEPVEVFPSYIYPIDFHFSVEALSMVGMSEKPGTGFKR